MARPLDMLTDDHREVKGLLGTLERAEDKNERIQALNRLEKALVVHERLEEEIFYPAVRENADQDGVIEVLEAREEHHLVNEVLHDLRSIEADSERFMARAHVLKELVTHHIDEEESEMFETARNVLSDEAMEDLGRRMEAERDNLMGTDLGSLRRPSSLATGASTRSVGRGS